VSSEPDALPIRHRSLLGVPGEGHASRCEVEVSDQHEDKRAKMVGMFRELIGRTRANSNSIFGRRYMLAMLLCLYPFVKVYLPLPMPYTNTYASSVYHACWITGQKEQDGGHVLPGAEWRVRGRRHFGPSFGLWGHGQLHAVLRLPGVTFSSRPVRSSRRGCPNQESFQGLLCAT